MAEPSTSSITSAFLVALLDQAGHPPDDLIAATALDRDALASPDVRVPLGTFRELWARAARLEPAIGLTLVDRFPPGQMHVLAHLAMRSRDVKSALEDVCRHAAATSAVDQFTLMHAGGLARFACASLQPAPDNPWMAEHYLAMTCSFMQKATDRALPIRAVRFSAPAQAPAAAYRARFGVDPSFNDEANAIEFDIDALDWPLVSHDAYLHAVLERVSRDRHAASSDSLVEVARRDIARAILQGKAPTILAISSGSKLTVRAFRERPSGVGISFRQLLDESRRELVREHLARGVSVTQTAYLLGFSEPAALQHACRRWFGQPAGDLRGKP